MKIKCPACSQVLAIPENAAGKVVKCPCGKQLRAPAAAAGGGAATSGGQSRPTPQRPATQRPATQRPATQRPAARKPATQRPAARKPAAPMGGFDPGLFDELTDQDLKPVAGGGAIPDEPAAPSGNTAKLLREHAATAGGATTSNFKVGDLASPLSRLAAIIIDGFVIGLMAGPILAAMFLFVAPSFFDFSALQQLAENPPTNAAEEQAASEAAQKIMVGMIEFYFIAMPASYLIPILVYALMVTKSGQTPGKKLCKIRIVTSDTKQLPGFVKGVLIRSWASQIVYAIPFVGLVGILLIFGPKRQCLHDMMAGTIVVDT
ncbi:RDD family protein [Rubripirellula sp.]|nr:RDD family protein [Rubripirellula sp.]